MKQYLFIFLVGLAMSPPAGGERTISEDVLLDKVRGMWLGELIGNNAGRATEGDYQTLPNPDPCVPWVIKLVWDGDDDTDLEYVVLHILEEHGFGVSEAEIAGQWLDHVSLAGIYIANRQALELMRDGVLPPGSGGREYNQHWYAIDSQITTEAVGGTCPGLPQKAIEVVGRLARVSNDGFPVHAAQYYAGLYARAFFEPDVETLVREGLDLIPRSSRTHQVISDVLGWYEADMGDGMGDWRATRQKLYTHYQGGYAGGRYYNWVESTVNTGATVLALLYGGGDFKETVQIGVLAGWDCDCNPATAGGLLGIILGYSGLPGDLTNPSICGDVYQNVYRKYLPDPCADLPQEESIQSIAGRIGALAEAAILANGGSWGYEITGKIFTIPEEAGIVPEAERYDPCGPGGLVGAALAAGIGVTPTAAVARYNAGLDRENLYGIMDGITDNTYNGHKAYWSYVATPGVRPDRDWYQLNFSQPVKFSGVRFYEGDVVWKRINTYYRDDAAKGGFFEDLTVEIWRDGGFIEPGNVQVVTGLERYEMYQTVEFSFAETVGEAIRIIGTAGGSEQFTTILELEAEGSVDPCVYVASVEIAGGQAQRSRVREAAVRFSRDVTVGMGDIALAGQINGTIFSNGQIDLQYDSGDMTMRLAFDMDGNGVYGDALPNDVYQLRLDCGLIRDGGGERLLDDDTSPGDGYYTIEFHSLFGDADGTGNVDQGDFGRLSGVWLGEAGQTGLDYAGDGAVTMGDLAGFAENWLADYR